MDHLDASQSDGCHRQGPEAQHRLHPPLYTPMVLLDPMLRYLLLRMRIALQCSLRPIPQTALRIAGDDCLPVGLAAKRAPPITCSISAGMHQTTRGLHSRSRGTSPIAGTIKMVVTGRVEMGARMHHDPQFRHVERVRGHLAYERKAWGGKIEAHGLHGPTGYDRSIQGSCGVPAAGC